MFAVLAPLLTAPFGNVERRGKSWHFPSCCSVKALKIIFAETKQFYHSSRVGSVPSIKFPLHQDFLLVMSRLVSRITTTPLKSNMRVILPTKLMEELH